MSIEAPSEQVELVYRRMRFMKGAFRGGIKQSYRERQLLPYLAIKAMSRWLFKKTKLIGHRSLDFIKDHQLGKDRITIAANHTSDVDHPALVHVLRENGYPEIADRLVFPAGLKMWDRPQTLWAMGGMSAVPVATPGYFEDVQEMLRLPLTEKQRTLIIQYESDMRRLNRESLNTVFPDWKNGQVVIVVYPETTRSRNGLMQRGRQEMTTYFKRGLVLPVMIQGPNEAFPPEQLPHLWKILERNVSVTVTLNEPIDAKRLQAQDTREWLEAQGANSVDFVMSRIAALNPQIVDPKFRPLYERLSSDIPKGLIINN